MSPLTAYSAATWTIRISCGREEPDLAEQLEDCPLTQRILEDMRNEEPFVTPPTPPGFDAPKGVVSSPKPLPSPKTTPSTGGSSGDRLPLLHQQ